MPSRLEFLHGTYAEDESYLSTGGPEPQTRSQNVIFHLRGLRWHVKVTLVGTLSQPATENSLGVRKSKSKRRADLQALIYHLEFERVYLLRDTVTEIILHLPPDIDRTTPTENEFAQIARQLTYESREDPSRVLYPPFDDAITETLQLSEIKKKKEVGSGVFQVQTDYYDMGNLFIYKQVDRPFYTPNYTLVLQQELENLKLFRGVSSIVQLMAVVVSRNPYLTSEQDGGSEFMRGLLLEFYPGGTLEDALKNRRTDLPWRRWPLQIAEGLFRLHMRNLAHMDLKPSNIVLDEEGNAVIIDISGIGGVTPEWMAPDIRDETDILSLSWDTRRRNDIWAFGRILSMIVMFGRDLAGVKLLRNLADEATKAEPVSRIGLPHIISRLRGWLGEDEANYYYD